MKIFFHTFGCKVNQYETQLFREMYTSRGDKITDNINSADLFIINSCTVTHQADSNCRQLLRRIIKTNPEKRIIVTGCYSAVNPGLIKTISNKIEIIDKHSLLSTCSGYVTHITGFHKHSRAFVKIQDGCDAYCSYCIVPYVRNKIRSKQKNTVINELNSLINNGYKEIVLCGIRLGRWNDKNEKLSDLISEIIKIDKNFIISLSSIELNEIDDKLINLFSGNTKLKKHLHIPLQSGDDAILKLMNRPYTSKEFTDKIKYIRSRIPDITVSTDIIVGFPGENELQFNNTYNLAKNLKFNKIHVFRYSARPGTAASKLQNTCPSIEVKKRAGILLKL